VPTDFVKKLWPYYKFDEVVYHFGSMLFDQQLNAHFPQCADANMTEGDKSGPVPSRYIRLRRATLFRFATGVDDVLSLINHSEFYRPA
jgi:hypothetical protein